MSCSFGQNLAEPCSGADADPKYEQMLPVGMKLLIVQELCESRGGRPGLSVLMSLLVFVDVKLYSTMLRHWSQLVPNNVNRHLRTLSITAYLPNTILFNLLCAQISF